VLGNPNADRKWRADASGQLGRNKKALWVSDFGALAGESERRAYALSDGRLTAACEDYMAGFGEDMNDYYTGLNAFGLLTAIVKLAEKEPDAWAACYPTPKKASDALEDFLDRHASVRGADLSRERGAERERQQKAGRLFAGFAGAICPLDRN
jgi:hypothetical protein